MMIRCIAVDDEPLALELLQDNISKIPFLQLVAGCNNAIEAMKVLEEEKVDLIFLDIQMPGLTGLQFINSMTTAKPMIILVTAYDKYAPQGFELDVLDYLVKPVPFDRFVKACNKAKELMILKTSHKENTDSDYFFVNVEYSLVKINKPDITYIEGLKDYLKIHLASAARPIVTRMPMKSIEEQLSPATFIRIHKSYIVSVAHITSIRKTTVFIDGLELPVGESYRDALNVLTGKQ